MAAFRPNLSRRPALPPARLWLRRPGTARWTGGRAARAGGPPKQSAPGPVGCLQSQRPCRRSACRARWPGRRCRCSQGRGGGSSRSMALGGHGALMMQHACLLAALRGHPSQPASQHSQHSPAGSRLRPAHLAPLPRRTGLPSSPQHSSTACRSISTSSHFWNPPEVRAASVSVAGLLRMIEPRLPDCACSSRGAAAGSAHALVPRQPACYSKGAVGLKDAGRHWGAPRSGRQEGAGCSGSAAPPSLTVCPEPLWCVALSWVGSSARQQPSLMPPSSASLSLLQLRLPPELERRQLRRRQKTVTATSARSAAAPTVAPTTMPAAARQDTGQLLQIYFTSAAPRHHTKAACPLTPGGATTARWHHCREGQVCD